LWNKDKACLLVIAPFKNVCLSNVGGASFMCLTPLSIYIDHWKCFMKFGIKKSHEMISYVLVWMALLSEWEHVMPTKPCKFPQMTLIKLLDKSYEGFVLSKCQENASMDQKA
jgi:hypothetical protein